MNGEDLAAIWLTAKLAGIVTLLLLMGSAPMAWWLARTSSRWKAPLTALFTLPMVLPPTVIGFYLLLLLGPNGAVGKITHALGIGLLPFTFGGLVIASMIYSLPFVMQPLKNSFEMIDARQLEVAATLRASPWQTFFSVVLPQAKPGFITAAVLGFAHTVGEFGVVLMIGGNIPEQTRVVSVQIYDHVEAMQYGNAHALSAVLLLFSFCVLLLISVRRRGNYFVN